MIHRSRSLRCALLGVLFLVGLHTASRADVTTTTSASVNAAITLDNLNSISVQGAGNLTDIRDDNGVLTSRTISGAVIITGSAFGQPINLAINVTGVSYYFDANRRKTCALTGNVLYNNQSCTVQVILTQATAGGVNGLVGWSLYSNDTGLPIAGGFPVTSNGMVATWIGTVITKSFTY